MVALFLSPLFLSGIDSEKCYGICVRRANKYATKERMIRHAEEREKEKELQIKEYSVKDRQASHWNESLPDSFLFKAKGDMYRK